ncbi:MAG: hypothetical protein MK006_02935 [Pirellulales bacterium]|nr:hypothetical protein [Pirellulales bacterium]
MRHRKRGRRLGRSSSHRKAMYRNMASSLFLTYRGEEVAEVYGYERKQPAGRIVTTLEKAKEVRSLVEKCITIARKAKPHREASEAIVAPSRFGKSEDSFSKKREPELWAQWSDARAPYVTAQRRCFQLLGSREAVALLFDVVVDEIGERTHGYTRIVRLATPRLGDAGTRAILEIVQDDKVRESYSSAEAPALEVEDDEAAVEDAETTEDVAESDADAADEETADDSAEAADDNEDTTDEAEEDAASEDDVEGAADSEEEDAGDDDDSDEEATAEEASDDSDTDAEAEEEASDDTEEAESSDDEEADSDDEDSEAEPSDD